MKIQKPTESTCWDGGEHKWDSGTIWSKCEKCGTHRRRRYPDQPWSFHIPTVYDHLKEEE